MTTATIRDQRIMGQLLMEFVPINVQDRIRSVVVDLTLAENRPYIRMIFTWEQSYEGDIDWTPDLPEVPLNYDEPSKQDALNEFIQQYPDQAFYTQTRLDYSCPKETFWVVHLLVPWRENPWGNPCSYRRELFTHENW